MRTAAKELGPQDYKFSSTGYEPKDNFFTETYVESNQKSMTEHRFTEQRFLEDMDDDGAAIGEMLSKAYPEQVYHSQRGGLSVGQSSSSVSDRTGQLVVELVAKSPDRTGQLVVESGKKPRSNGATRCGKSSRTEPYVQIRTLSDRQREQILAACTAEIRRHEFQADFDRRSIQRDQPLLHEELLEQNWNLREAHEKSLKEMEELKRFQGSTSDTIARRRVVEDQDSILELTGMIQELQNEIICMNDLRDFQDAESVRSGQSHVSSQPAFFFPRSSRSWWNAEPFFWNAEPQRRAAKRLGHARKIGKRFCKSSRVLCSTLSARVKSMDL